MGNKKRINPPYRNYEVNQHKILAAYKDLAAEGIVLPSYEQVADRSGLSLSTVKRHFANLNFDYVCKRERIHTPEVINAIRESALDGKARAQKLYAQIMEGYIERKDHKQEIVGDLKVNADISGELKVNIQRGIIKSKDDLLALQDVAKTYKNFKAAESAPDKAGKAEDLDSDVFQALNKIVESPTVQAETLIIFK